jgi:hypothetical protein
VERIVPQLTGESISAAEQQGLRSCLIERWTDPDKSFPGAPLWTRFPDRTVLAIRSIIHCVLVPDDEWVIYYDERPLPGTVSKVRFGDVRNFVASYPEYGSRTDHYFMAIDMTWCIAYTHEEVREGHLLFLLGEVPLASA